MDRPATTGPRLRSNMPAVNTKKSCIGIIKTFTFLSSLLSSTLYSTGTDTYTVKIRARLFKASLA